MFENKITDNNFLVIAMNHYDNSQCTNLKEFEEDIKRFSYLKKLFFRYHQNNDLKERLILNHIIILYNLFGLITTDLLFFKIDKEYWSTLITFLIFLDKMPDEIPEFNIKLSNCIIDKSLLNLLKEL